MLHKALWPTRAASTSHAADGDIFPPASHGIQAEAAQLRHRSCAAHGGDSGEPSGGNCASSFDGFAPGFDRSGTVGHGARAGSSDKAGRTSRDGGSWKETWR